MVPAYIQVYRKLTINPTGFKPALFWAEHNRDVEKVFKPAC
jgi:hypothetical protein